MNAPIHTRGPWTCHSGSVWQDGPRVWPKGNELGVPICRMDRETGNGTMPIERDANALLISKTPELLIHLDELCDWVEDTLHRQQSPTNRAELEQRVKNARELMAKARGEVPA